LDHTENRRKYVRFLSGAGWENGIAFTEAKVTEQLAQLLAQERTWSGRRLADALQPRHRPHPT
jgi:hypothetical protein